MTGSFLSRLHGIILAAFTESDLRICLTLDLGFVYDDRVAQAKAYVDKVLDVLRLFETEGRLGELLAALQARRRNNVELQGLHLEWHALTSLVVPLLPMPNSRFIGRDAELARIDERLGPGVMLALTGMPGVGKSDLALAYVYRHRPRWTTVLWCNAERLDDLLGSYAAQPDIGAAATGGEITARAAVVLAWLRQQRNCLLVLDNVADWQSIAAWVPTGPGTCVLLTARQLPDPRLEELAVDLLPQATAVDLILGPAANADEPTTQAAHELARRLDRLPLALGYCRNLLAAGHYSVGELLEIFSAGGIVDMAAAAAASEEPLLAPIRACVERTRKRDPRAADVLLATAFLCPDGVPEEVLQRVCCDHAVKLPPLLIQVGDGLLRRHPATRLVRVHRVMQDLLIAVQSAEEQRARVERIVVAVAELFPMPGMIEHWPQCERLRATAMACARWIDRLDLRNDHAVTLLHRVGFYLEGQGLHFAVEPLYKRALAILEHLRPADDPQLAELRNHIGWMHRSLGDADRADQLYNQALAALQMRDDPESLRRRASVLHNLATLRHDRGRFDEALLLHDQALAIRRALNGNDPKTALSLNNRGWLLAEMGRLDEADAMLCEALQIRRTTLAADHPDIATTLALQAHVLRCRGDHSAARDRYRAALAMREGRLGPQHPRNASILNELGELELISGNLDAATAHFTRARQLLTAARLDRVPDAVWWRRGLARVARLRGHTAEAAQLYGEALDRAEAVMSKHHHDVGELAAELTEFTRPT